MDRPGNEYHDDDNDDNVDDDDDGLDWSQGAFWQSADTIGLHWVGVNLLLTPDREPFQNSPYAPFLQFQLGSSYTTINMETMHRSYRVIKKVKADHLGISGTSGKSGKSGISGTDKVKEFSDWSLLPAEILVRIMKYLLSGYPLMMLVMV